MSESLHVIANAHSHSGENAEDELRKALKAAGVEATLHMVDDPAKLDDVIGRAIEAKPRCIVAAGGDGTVNAVAKHAIEAGVTMGVLPAGTLNHFARDLGLPDDLEAAARVLAEGEMREVDVGEVNGKLFLNNSSLGLYAQMVAHRDQIQSRRHLGKWSALVQASWHALRRPQAFSVVLHADGEELRRYTPFVFVGNNDYVVQGPHAGERACLDDGVLSVYVLRPHTTWGLIGLALRALIGQVSDRRDMDAIATTSLVVESGKHSVRLARDGEVEMTDSPVRFRVMPRALKVLAPRPEPA
ncbi:diacylglycerol/lipid kinase family protein [Lysobacter sp. HA35]